MEDALKVIARNHATTRFVKLHVLDAEMDEIAAPGILAYKAGECFANLVSLTTKFPLVGYYLHYHRKPFAAVREVKLSTDKVVPLTLYQA